MIDLTKAVLPNTVTVHGVLYEIQTDFHYWINFNLILQEEENPLYSDFDFMYKFNKPEDRQEGFFQLLKFNRQKKLLPRPTSNSGTDEIIFDYKIDSDLIYSAFFEQYGIDLCNSTLHWFKFQSLFEGLHDTKLNDVMSYRSYDPNYKYDYKKDMEEKKKAWLIEKKIDKETQKALDKFNAKFK